MDAVYLQDEPVLEVRVGLVALLTTVAVVVLDYFLVAVRGGARLEPKRGSGRLEKTPTMTNSWWSVTDKR